jgi:hypothetical protein
MKLNRTTVLAVVLVVETAAIAVLLTDRFRMAHRRLVPVTLDPLQLAVEYDASDQRFEELVKTNPEWMHYRAPVQNAMSILSACALIKRTNYVRILIDNGADVDEALQWHKRFGTEESIALLHQINNEVKGRGDSGTKTNPPAQQP